MDGARRTHLPLALRDPPVRSGFLAAPSSTFANRRGTWREVVGGRTGVGLGKGLGNWSDVTVPPGRIYAVAVFWVDSTKA